jgi:intergrase/recombinase
LQTHQLALKIRANYTRRGLKRKFLDRACHVTRETRKTASAIPAHFRFTTIRVVIAHAKIRAVRRTFEHQNSIGADTAIPITKPSDLLSRELQIARAIVDHDEIVPRAVHLRETQHGQFVPHSLPKAK